MASSDDDEEPSWIDDLVEHLEAVLEEGLPVKQALKVAVKRRLGRNVGGMQLSTLRRRLHQWHTDKRIEELFDDEYVAPEILDLPALRLVAEAHGVELSPDPADPPLQTLVPLVIAAQNVEIEEELAEIAAEPAVAPPPVNYNVACVESHPAGVGPWVPDRGKHRTHQALRRAGELDPPLPAEALSLVGASCYMFSQVDDTMVPWASLKGKGMKWVCVECTVSGCTASSTAVDTTLEIFELVQPFRTADLAEAMWRSIPSVSSALEACATHRANPTLTVFLNASKAKVNLDDNLSWAGEVVFLDGTSALSSLDYAKGMHPDFSALAAHFGHVPGTPLYASRSAIATGLARASQSAMHGLMAANKGKRHANAITEVKADLLSKDLSPADGTPIARDASADTRLREALKVATPSTSPSLPRCYYEWWCLPCNALEITKALAEKGTTYADVADGRCLITLEVAKVITTLGPGNIFCTGCNGSCSAAPLYGSKGPTDGAHQGLANLGAAISSIASGSGSTKAVGYPPLDATVLCPREGCNTWWTTHPECPFAGCPQCGFSTSSASSSDLKLDLSKAYSFATTARHVAQLRFSMLRLAAGGTHGQCALQAAGFYVPNLEAWRATAYEISQNPDSYQPGVASTPASALDFVLDARKLEWLSLAQHDSTGVNGLCYLDFQPVVVLPTKALSAKQLKDLSDTAHKQGVPPSSIPVPKCGKNDLPLDPSANAAYVDFVLACVTRMINAFAWASSLDRSPDALTSVTATRSHLLSSADYSYTPPFWHVIQVVGLALDDPSKRLGMSARNPTRCYLTDYERKSGRSIRMLTAYSCELVVRHTMLVQERSLWRVAATSARAHHKAAGALTASKPSKSKADRLKGADRDRKKDAKDKDKKDAAAKKSDKKKAEQKKKSEEQKQKKKATAEEKKGAAERKKQRRARGKKASEDEEESDEEPPRPVKKKARDRTARGKDADPPSEEDPEPPKQKDNKKAPAAKGGKGGKGGRGRGAGKAANREGRARGHSHHSESSGSDSDSPGSESELSDAEPDPQPPAKSKGKKKQKPPPPSDSDSGDDGSSSGDDEDSARGKAGAEAERLVASLSTQCEGCLELVPGAYHGEGALPKLRKLLASATTAAPPSDKPLQCLPCCPRFNSHLGCDAVCCPFPHECSPGGCADWSPAWHSLFMGSWGGHHELEGKLSEAHVLGLLSPKQQATVATLEDTTRSDVLHHHLMTRITNLSYSTNEPLDLYPIQSGRSRLVEVPLWGSSAPFKMAAPSRSQATAISRMAVGEKDALFSGLCYDMDQVVELPDGTEVDSMCQINSSAALVSTAPRTLGSVVCRSANLIMLRQYLDSVLAIDSEAIPCDSRLAQLYEITGACELSGMADSLWALGHSDLNRDAHEFKISVPKDDRAPIHLYLNIVHSNVSHVGEMDYTPANFNELASRSFSSRALACAVHTTVALPPESHSEYPGRHARAMTLAKGYTLKELVTKLAQLAKVGAVKITLAERGCARKLAQKKRRTKVPRKSLLQAHARLTALRDRLGEAQPWELSAREAASQEALELLAQGVADQSRRETDYQGATATAHLLEQQVQDLADSLEAEVNQAFTNLNAQQTTDRIVTEKHHRSLRHAARKAQEELDFSRALAISTEASREQHRVLHCEGSRWLEGICTKVSAKAPPGAEAGSPPVLLYDVRPVSDSQCLDHIRGLPHTVVIPFAPRIMELQVFITEARDTLEAFRVAHRESLTPPSPEALARGQATPPPVLSPEEGTPPPCQDQPLPDRHQFVEEWITWASATDFSVAKLRKAKNSGVFLRAYAEVYEPLAKATSEKEGDDAQRSLTFIGRFFNTWFDYHLAKGRTERQALEAITSSLRSQFKDRASEGPDWPSIRQVFEAGLSQNHLDLLHTTLVKGGDPVFTDTHEGKGQRLKPYPLSSKVTMKLLWNMIAELEVGRALLFDISEHGMADKLMRAGVHISPVVTAPKTEDHGAPRYDEAGDPALRICVDSKVANEALRSGDHTRQKTTDHTRVALKVLEEEKRNPGKIVRFSKADICSAFKLIGNALRRVGLYAFEANDFALVNLTMIFGSGSSPGLFDPLGDAILTQLMSTSRHSDGGDPEWNGEHHPMAARFCDDLLSIISIFGDRLNDHLSRLRGIIVALLGPGGVNLEKEEENGEAANYKHAFGVVLDATERLMMAPWSKIVKVYDLIRPYVNGEQSALTSDQVFVLRGVAAHVCTCAPWLGRVLMPRLDAMLADGARHFPRAHKPPSSFTPSPKLQGETEDTAHRMFRRILNLTLRLATVSHGELLRLTFEMALPREIRTSWPGREGPDAIVDFLMDASGESLFCIDLRNGEWFKVVFTPEEQEVFNAFERGEWSTNINQRELLTELFVIVLQGPKHARGRVGRIMNMINDNRSAEHRTSGSNHRDARAEQILAVMGIVEGLLRLTCVGSRVLTTQNFADYGTRSDKQHLFWEGLAQLEEKHGWKATEIEVPGWLRHVGWQQFDQELPERDWFLLAFNTVRHIEESHPGEMARCTGIPDVAVQVQAALQDAADLKPLPPTPVADGDFPVKGYSQQRRALTAGGVPATQNTLLRRHHQLQAKLGDRLGTRKFQTELNAPLDSDPRAAVANELQKRHDWAQQLLRSDNTLYSPDFTRPPSPSPTPLHLPQGHRSNAPIQMGTRFSGTDSVGTAVIDSGLGALTSTAEADAWLHEGLKEKHPEAFHMKDAFDPDPSAPEGLHYSPPCVTFSQSNLNASLRSGFGGHYYERSAEDIVQKQLAFASIECTKEVRLRRGGPSAFDVAKRHLRPHYHLVKLVVNAGSTISPLTGQKAPLQHERFYVLAFLKAIFLSCPVVEPPSAPMAKSFSEFLDHPEEGSWYYEMPKEDQRALTVNSAKRPKKPKPHTTAVIFDPEEGRGHLWFPNDIQDPSMGPCSVATASSGTKWFLRVLNGKVSITRLQLRELSRIYLARHLGTVSSWSQGVEASSFAAQMALGNMIPNNVADWLVVTLFLAYTKVQSDGRTAQEKYADMEQEGVAAGRKRDPPKITRQVDEAIKKTAVEIQLSGKKPKTYEDYNRGWTHWRELCEAKHWDPFFEDVPPGMDELPHSEKQRRTIYYCAYEKSQHNLKADSIRSKLSGVRWMFVKTLRRNPFPAMESVTDWLANLKKADGPANPKIPVPITLLMLVGAFMDLDTFDHSVLWAAMLTGFWFLLRSVEYLADDEGFFDPDRSLTWADVCFQDAQGNILPFHLFALAVEMTLTLYSSKNSLETCTRSLGRVPESETCVVAAIIAVLQMHLKHKGELPSPSAPVFAKASGEAYTRDDVSKVLKLAAESCKIPGASVASHSLRRGACSSYIAAGCGDEHIARFGRWTSLAYKAYVFAHAKTLNDALRKATHLVPRFERN